MLCSMTKHFNKSNKSSIRKYLRNNPTTTEKFLWQFLKRKRLAGYKFRRQYSVDNYIVDFYCPKVKLAIEIDGSSHDYQDRKVYDYKRQKYIESFGITFIRFKSDEVFYNVDCVLSKIMIILKKL